MLLYSKSYLNVSRLLFLVQDELPFMPRLPPLICFTDYHKKLMNTIVISLSDMCLMYSAVKLISKECLHEKKEMLIWMNKFFVLNLIILHFDYSDRSRKCYLLICFDWEFISIIIMFVQFYPWWDLYFCCALFVHFTWFRCHKWWFNSLDCFCQVWAEGAVPSQKFPGAVCQR